MYEQKIKLLGTRGMTLIRCPFHPVLPQWLVKDPAHSAKSADGRLHLNTHTPLTRGSRSGLTVLSRNLCGNLTGKRADTQLVMEYSAKVVLAR